MGLREGSVDRVVEGSGQQVSGEVFVEARCSCPCNRWSVKEAISILAVN
jgi:hypothetical protein